MQQKEQDPQVPGHRHQPHHHHGVNLFQKNNGASLLLRTQIRPFGVESLLRTQVLQLGAKADHNKTTSHHDHGVGSRNLSSHHHNGNKVLLLQANKEAIGHQFLSINKKKIKDGNLFLLLLNINSSSSNKTTRVRRQIRVGGSLSTEIKAVGIEADLYSS